MIPWKLSLLLAVAPLFARTQGVAQRTAVSTADTPTHGSVCQDYGSAGGEAMLGRHPITGVHVATLAGEGQGVGGAKTPNLERRISSRFWPVNARTAAAPAQHLNIHLYDLANISPHTLDTAVLEATRVLATAGVEVVWQLGSTDAPEAHANDQTATPAAWRQTPDTRDYLVVRIVAGFPARTLPDALGYSLPDTKMGVHATVLYDRIAALCQSGAIGVAALLGHVMAHEIGHVLLGTTEHSLGGIMKARWGRPDYQRAAMGFLDFTRAQRAAIRERLLRCGRQCSI